MRRLDVHRLCLRRYAHVRIVIVCWRRVSRHAPRAMFSRWTWCLGALGRETHSRPHIFVLAMRAMHAVSHIVNHVEQARLD